MTADLPSDLRAFLRDGRQLDCDAGKSEIGPIKLKRESDLCVSTIDAPTGCQSIISDPHSELDGFYAVDVYDLVAESKDYDATGLLCWIVALERLGCVDSEHGDVITFPGVTWTDLTNNPLIYLDAQWGDHEEVVERVLPWIHFPFRHRSTGTVLLPYASHCSIHGSPVIRQETQKPPMFDWIFRRNSDDWLDRHSTDFPCAGLPLSDDEMLCCSDCRSAEDLWIQKKANAIETHDVTPNAHGWVKCPFCGTRFSITDSAVFQNGMHRCGQKLNVVT